MKLMQELLSAKPEQLEEDATGEAFTRFKRLYTGIEDKLDVIEVTMKEGSHFSKLVKSLGGDMAILKRAKAHLEGLIDEMQQLEMNVHVTNQVESED